MSGLLSLAGNMGGTAGTAGSAASTAGSAASTAGSLGNLASSGAGAAGAMQNVANIAGNSAPSNPGVNFLQSALKSADTGSINAGFGPNAFQSLVGNNFVGRTLDQADQAGAFRPKEMPQLQSPTLKPLPAAMIQFLARQKGL